jgi:hypothetical protein
MANLIGIRFAGRLISTVGERATERTAQPYSQAIRSACRVFDRPAEGSQKAREADYKDVSLGFLPFSGSFADVQYRVGCLVGTPVGRDQLALGFGDNVGGRLISRVGSPLGAARTRRIGSVQLSALPDGIHPRRTG